MKEFENAHAIKNPFKFYRYEVIGAFRSFSFETEDILTRTNLHEDGYDDLTEITKLEDESELVQKRMAPVLGPISEEFFIENSEDIYFGDCVATQDWSESDRITLLNKLRGQPRIIKVSVEEFEKTFVSKYKTESNRSLTISDVKSLNIDFIYFTNHDDNSIKISVSDLEFNDDLVNVIEEKSFVYSDKNIIEIDRKAITIDESILKYYYDSKNHLNNLPMESLTHEYALTPVMVLESDLYKELKYKIKKVTYESGGAVL